MKIEDILDEWEKDAEFDKTRIEYESLLTPKLHHKYYKMLLIENSARHAAQGQLDQLVALKTQYYEGKESDEMKRRGWPDFNETLDKQGVKIRIDGDQEIIIARRKLFAYEEKVNFLHSCLKTISYRSFDIKNHIDYLKFKHGIT